VGGVKRLPVVGSYRKSKFCDDDDDAKVVEEDSISEMSANTDTGKACHNCWSGFIFLGCTFVRLRVMVSKVEDTA
jgi:hypothetical protein